MMLIVPRTILWLRGCQADDLTSPAKLGLHDEGTEVIANEAADSELALPKGNRAMRNLIPRAVGDGRRFPKAVNFLVAVRSRVTRCGLPRGRSQPRRRRRCRSRAVAVKSQPLAR